MSRRRVHVRHDWRRRTLRVGVLHVAFWSTFWAAESALAGLWPNLADHVPTPLFVALGIVLPAAHALAGVFKLTGAEA